MKKLLCVLFVALISNAHAQTATLNCNAGGNYNSNFLINNVLQDEGTCNNLNKKINIAVLDSCTFLPWTTDSCVYGYFGQLNYNDCIGNSTCFGHPQPYTYFQFECADSVQMNGLVTLLTYIPTGNHVLAFSFSVPPYSFNGIWSPTVRNTFAQLGSTMMNTLADTLPFIFYIKKGYPSTVHEVSGTNAADIVSLTGTIECLPASVYENQNESLSVTVFPNPTRDQFTIYDLRCTIEKIEIYSALGEKVFSQKLKANSQEQQINIDVSSFNTGIYFAQIKTDNGIVTKKIIKQ